MVVGSLPEIVTTTSPRRVNENNLDNEFNLVEKRLQLQYADALAHHPDKVRQRIERLDAIKTSLDQKKPKVKVVRKEEEV